MTVAENIKRSTKPMSLTRTIRACENCVKHKILISSFSNSNQISAAEYWFIDGSKLTCRVYW
jgi:hypothetical protein